jgi:hypothetical protein
MSDPARHPDPSVDDEYDVDPLPARIRRVREAAHAGTATGASA